MKRPSGGGTLSDELENAVVEALLPLHPEDEGDVDAGEVVPVSLISPFTTQCASHLFLGTWRSVFPGNVL